MKPQSSIGLTTRIGLLACAIFLLTSVFVPIWRIELSAPQYPEGLVMLIYASKLGGDVEIINGLNHYIGMQTLHAENFIEFTILPYLLAGLASLFFATFILGRKRVLYFTCALFVLFGVISMIDFWFWEYNYGHNLDPTAAIVVPGMAYQPPLIGYKKLLNFGAYSIPDTGGWLLLGTGVIIVALVVLEMGLLKSLKNRRQSSFLLLAVLLSFSSCTPQGPSTIRVHQDACAYCKMAISELNFASQALTEKGRNYKFDDIKCLLQYQHDNPEQPFRTVYISTYDQKGEWVDAEQGWYMQSPEFKSPMGGNWLAFMTQQGGREQSDTLPLYRWQEVLLSKP